MKTLLIGNKKCICNWCVELLWLGLFLSVGAHPQKQGTRQVTMENTSNDASHCDYSVTKVSDFNTETVVRWNNSCFKEETITSGTENSTLREVWLHESQKKLMLLYVDGILKSCREEDASDGTADECSAEPCNEVDSHVKSVKAVFRNASQPDALSWFSSPENLRRDCLNLQAKEQDEISKRMLRNERGDRQKRGIFSQWNNLIAPGTKWCGWGDRAKKYTDLGGFSKADTCCRKHDTRCRYYIPAFKSRYGLTNTGFSTLMHCSCDDGFRSCLKMANTSPSNFIGKIFFNLVSTECFVIKRERVCKKWSWWGKCERYIKKNRAYMRKNARY